MDAAAPGARLTPAATLPVGSHVRVVAPSGPVDPQRLDRGCGVLRRLGFEVSLGRYVLARDDLPYLAGSDRARAEDLEHAWCDPAVDAVWAARGGYGAARTLAQVDWTVLRAARGQGPVKPVIGSSDVTALLFAFAQRLGAGSYFGPTVAGPVLGGPDPNRSTLDSLDVCLLRAGAPFDLRGQLSVAAGTAHGPIIAGTLSMICSLAATPDYGSARGAIVLLEDVGEAPYRIDRMLTHLQASGWLHGVAGIGCGSWERCGPPDQIQQVLHDRLGSCGVPVVTGLPFGHGQHQATLPIGADAVLDAQACALRVRARHPHQGP